MDPALASSVAAGPLATAGQGHDSNETETTGGGGPSATEGGFEGQGQDSNETEATGGGPGETEGGFEDATAGSRDRSGEAAHAEDMETQIVSRMQACADSGGVMDPFGVLCCPASCGLCGGEGCANRQGGADACCGDNIASAAVECGSPPCLLGSGDSTAIAARVSVCALAGGVADDTGLRCCDSACGTCGGKLACPCPSSASDALNPAKLCSGSEQRTILFSSEY